MQNTSIRPLHFPLVLLLASVVNADTVRVPQDHRTIQEAIDASRPGDTILVAAGTYQERLELKPHIRLRSAGDDTPGKGAAGRVRLKRAETTVIDGGGEQGDQPGVQMAEGSSLDGFTITNVGRFREDLWQEHYDSQGEALGDDEGAAQAEGTVPAISIRGIECRVTHCIVHHNGDAGIAVIGTPERPTTPWIANNTCYRNLGGGIGVADHAQPIIRDNTCNENLRAGIGCRNAQPLVLNNDCFGNIRAGIGCREGAKPIIRGNRCHNNRRAGIGIRMNDTAPVVERNECYQNDMAGIGCRDGATPILRENDCFENKMAGIGSDGARPLISGNRCRKNQMAGIGLRGGSVANIHGNHCTENKLVAIGITQASEAVVTRNNLSRTGGVPPIVAVKDDSAASITDNTITGGGVAAILVQGSANIRDNEFQGAGGRQGNAVWIWKDSAARISDNVFRGYRTTVDATQSEVVVSHNEIWNFQTPAIIVRASTKPADIYENRALSADETTTVVQLEGPAGLVRDNIVEAPK